MTHKFAILIIVHIFLFSCRSHYVKKEEKFVHFSMKDSETSMTLNDSLSRYKQKVESETKRVIAVSSDGIVKDGHESTLGNFVCEALKESMDVFTGENCDVVIMNRGGLRTNLPKGDIRVINIFELMPFENELVLLSIKGADLLQFVPHVIEKKHAFYGLKIKITDGKATSVLVGDKEIDPDKYYSVLTSDYLAKGGDSFTFLSKPAYVKNSGLKIRDAIILYCEKKTKQQQQIIPYKDGRLEISK